MTQHDDTHEQARQREAKERSNLSIFAASYYRQARIMTIVHFCFLLLACVTTTTSFEPMGTSTLGRGFFQLVVDEDGETSILQREFSQVESIGYSNVPQLCRSLDPRVAVPKGITFTQMSGENPWHHCPAAQIVVTLEGTWYVRTTDGKTTELPQGAVLFQDNVPTHPAAVEGTTKAQHFSGSLTEACTQMIVQLEQPTGPIVDSATTKSPM